MVFFKRVLRSSLLAGLAVVSGCVILPANQPSPNSRLSFASTASSSLGTYALTGDLAPLRDPAVMRQGATYYVYGTDVQPGSGPYLPIRCSSDKIAWTDCGHVFQTLPAWLNRAVPGTSTLWAPDISYFNGLYHLYYSAESNGATAIGVAVSPTLDPHATNYAWNDLGAVVANGPSDPTRAIDPNILVDADGAVWLTYGSYRSGIKQAQIDPATSKLRPGAPQYALATRPGVDQDPEEGASLVHHGSYYYLFVSVDFCCDQNVRDDDYKQAVGRSSSPHGPFVDQHGTPMMAGGGTVLLQGDDAWGSPGGGTVYLDPSSGDSLIVFHAFDLSQNSFLASNLWVKNIAWIDDWPVPQ